MAQPMANAAFYLLEPQAADGFVGSGVFDRFFEAIGAGRRIVVIDRYRAATMAFDYYGDTVLNSVCDSIACLGGFFAARRLPVAVTLLLVVVFEAFTLHCIRDSLALNVIMLVWPLDVIRAWQAGG